MKRQPISMAVRSVILQCAIFIFMTIPEEIEQLKLKLAQTADDCPDSYREQGEILLEILKKYEEINSIESQLCIDQLLVLAEKLNEPLYKAWGQYHLTNIKFIKGEYDLTLNLCQEALSVFVKITELSGIAACHNNIGAVYVRQGKFPEALKNHFTALKLSEETGDKYSIARSYSNIGSVYLMQSNYSEALKNHFSSLKLMEEVGKKSGIAYSYSNLGIVYYMQGNYPEALKNHFSSLKLREEIGDKYGIGRSYSNIGSVYYMKGNYPEALKNHFASLKFNEEIGDKASTVYSYFNIGAVYKMQGNYPEALKNNLASLKLSEEIGEKPGIAFAYGEIGEVYIRQDNYPEALKNHFAALKLWEETGNKYGIGCCFSNIGLVYEKQGNYPEALKNHFDSLKLGEEIEAQDLIKLCSLRLFNTYKAIHDFENALKYHEKYHQVENKILGELAQKQVTNLSFMHNLEQKEKEAEINRLRNVELKGAIDHLQIEKDNSEKLLLNILPAEVAEELKAKGTIDAKLFEAVTVLYTDFVSFTKVSERLSPKQLVNELHTCFSAFDEIMSRHNIEKIKTMGDAYIAVAGLPLPYASHAEGVVRAATEIRNFIINRKKELGENTFDMRIGVHSGAVVAGIVGVKKFAYDIWGDTVNTAARMEQNSEAGKINISQTTYELVKDKFTCQYRGEIEAKNKGKLKMYFVG